MKRWITLLLVVLLTACADIPTEGPVEEVAINEDVVGIDIAPQPPETGAEAGQIAEGFLLALADPEADYAVARQYLTAEAAEKWEPHAQTAVYSGDLVQREGRVLVEGTELGHLDEQGRFTTTTRAFSHDLALTEVDGEWRIAAPPEGIIVSSYLFERFFTHLNIYFMARSGSHVVPDLVSWPEQMVTPAQIMEALFAGPSPALSGAVSNAVPQSIKLGSRGATIDDDGVVTIDFESLNPNMGEDARRRLGAQVLWSMSSLPRVSGIRITNGGVSFPLPGQSSLGVLEIATQQSFQVLTRAASQNLYGVNGEQAGVFTDRAAFHPFPGNQPAAADVAVALDGSQIAVLGSDRAQLHMGPSPEALGTVEMPYQAIRSMHFSLGALYGIGTADNGVDHVFAIEPDGVARTVRVTLPDGLQMRTFRLSQAGVNAAVLAERDGEIVLGKMTLLPGQGLTRWKEIRPVTPEGEPVAEVVDVQWNSESTWVIAGMVGGEQQVLTLRTDGSQPEVLGPVESRITQLAALPRQGGGLVALRAGGGEVWRYATPNLWAATGITAASISYPG